MRPSSVFSYTNFAFKKYHKITMYIISASYKEIMEAIFDFLKVTTL